MNVLFTWLSWYFKQIIFLTAPSKPTIDVPKKGKVIPATDTIPVVVNVGDNITALTNTTIRINCPVSGVPKPKITWTRNGEEISSIGKYRIDEDGTLIMTVANSNETGLFTCRAINRFGEDSRTTKTKLIGKFTNYVVIMLILFFIERNIEYLLTKPCQNKTVSFQLKSRKLFGVIN